MSCPLYLIIHLPTNHIGHLSPALPTSSPLHLPYLLLHYVDAFLEFGEQREGGVELLLAEVAQRIAAVGEAVDVQLLVEVELADELGNLAKGFIAGV